MCDRVVMINEGKFVKSQEIGEKNSDESISKKYEIKSNNVERAQDVLKNKMNKECEIKDGKLYVSMKPADVSSVVKTLVYEDIDVEGINECENTLESIFFDVTKEGKDNE